MSLVPFLNAPSFSLMLWKIAFMIVDIDIVKDGFSHLLMLKHYLLIFVEILIHILTLRTTNSETPSIGKTNFQKLLEISSSPTHTKLSYFPPS
jgi:hypothetical protein